MFLKKNFSPALPVYFLALAVIYFVIKFCGYTFVPVNGFLFNVISAAIIIFLTWNGFVNREANQSKFLFVLLPVFGVLFIILKWLATDLSGFGTNIYIAHCFLTLVCCLILFFRLRNKAVKIILGIIYTLATAAVFFLLLLALSWANGDTETVVTAQLSPSGAFLAEVVASDQGALGGDTLVNITKQHLDINIFVGTLRLDAQTIYSDRLEMADTVTLRWDTDEYVYINGVKYAIEQERLAHKNY